MSFIFPGFSVTRRELSFTKVKLQGFSNPEAILSNLNSSAFKFVKRNKVKKIIFFILLK